MFKSKSLYIKIFIIVLFFVGVLFLTNRKDQETVIVLTEKGFSPAGVKVTKGTIVKFINKTDKDFWPASDFHPTHNIYSEFDPKKGITKGDSWKMNFDKAGTFRYHDHITPIYRGTIIVVEDKIEQKGRIGVEYSFEECNNETDVDKKRNCFSSVLQDIILKKGPDAAFKLVKELREINPDFAAECHTIVHSLGEISYWKYSKDKKLPQTGMISTCGFGYIHGFMQELGHHSQSFVQDAKIICDHLSQKIDYSGFEQAVNPDDQCYHGVGHGLAYFYVPDNSNDLAKVISNAARDCEDLTNEETSTSNCKYGIYGGIASMYVGSHGIVLPLDQDNPFSVCNSQDETLKDACFDSMVPVLGVLWDKDIERIANVFSEIEEKYLKQSFYNFGDLNARWVAMGEINSEDVIKVCTSLKSTVSRQSCFNGLSEGTIRNGFPKNAPLLALNFCQSKSLSQREKEVCIIGFLTEMKLVYPDKIPPFLLNLDSKEREFVCSREEMIEYCN